jgi:hypothetical protein
MLITDSFFLRTLLMHHLARYYIVNITRYITQLVPSQYITEFSLPGIVHCCPTQYTTQSSLLSKIQSLTYLIHILHSLTYWIPLYIVQHDPLGILHNLSY